MTKQPTQKNKEEEKFIEKHKQLLKVANDKDKWFELQGEPWILMKDTETGERFYEQWKKLYI